MKKENDKQIIRLALIMGSNRASWTACVRQCVEHVRFMLRLTRCRIVDHAVSFALINYCYYSARGLFLRTIITVMLRYGIASIHFIGCSSFSSSIALNSLGLRLFFFCTSMCARVIHTLDYAIDAQNTSIVCHVTFIASNKICWPCCNALANNIESARECQFQNVIMPVFLSLHLHADFALIGSNASINH